MTLITVAAVWCVYSTVAFAVPTTMTGAITVLGQVTVNGQPAVSNATVFSGSTIAAGDDSSAVIGFGKSGRIEIAPKTTLALSFHEGLITGELTSGSITVLNSANGVQVKTLSGEIVVLNAGETASAEAGKTTDDDYKDSSGKCVDADKDGTMECDNGGAWWIWALVFGGAAVGIVWAASNGNEPSIGGNTTTVSPTR